ncbi:MAG: AAA family ATPase [Acidimicrobiales bacterium]
MPHLVVIVVGQPELGAALAKAGRLPEVVTVSDTEHPTEAMLQAAKGRQRSDLVFVVADTGDPSQEKLLKLSKAGFRVVVLTGLNPGGATGYPNELDAPFTLNDVLATLASLPGVGYIPPLPYGDEVIGRAAQPDDTEADLWAALADDDVPTWTPEPEAPARPEDPEEAPDSRPPWLSAPRGMRAAPAPDPGSGAPPWATPAEAPRPAQPARQMQAIPAPAPTADPDEAWLGSWDSIGDHHETWVPPPATSEFHRGGGAAKGRLIVFSTPKGGSGKTTVSLNSAEFLARSMAEVGKKVCLLDANVQQADTATRLGLPPGQPTIAAIAQDPVFTEQSLRRVVIDRPELAMDVIIGTKASSAEANPDVVSPELYRKVARILVSMYDYVIVDTPVAERFHSLFADFVLPIADELIVVAQPDEAAIQNIASWLQVISDPIYSDGANFPRERISIVLNQAEKGIGCDEEEVRARLPWRWLGSIPNLKAWRKANNEGTLMVNDPEVVQALRSVLWLATAEPSLDPAAVKGEGRKLFRRLVRR